MAAMLDRLIEEYADRGYQFAYHLCGNVDEAQDIVQEAFMRVIRGWDSFDQNQEFGNWFLSILKNVYLDGKKRYERRNGVSLDVPINTGDPEATSYADVLADGLDASLLERLGRQQGQDEVRSAFDGLSEDSRAVLTLCDIQGLSYDEISTVIGVPVGTVRSRIARARKFLRKALAGTESAREVLES
jgi:RNA polymerase sigma-70 factor (ECF subfamily)